jgi:hypothetical protein
VVCMSSMLVYHTPHLTRYPIWGMWAVGIRGSKLKGCWCVEVLEYVITCVMNLARTANVIGDHQRVSQKKPQRLP